MENKFHEKYLKYKSKYLNLTSNIEYMNNHNQKGGENKYASQYKVTFMLNIKDGIKLKDNISTRYEKISEYIPEVERQNPHITLFELIINGDNQQVKEAIEQKKRTITNKTDISAIKAFVGNCNKDISDFSVNYLQGIDSYVVFENNDKYFLAKEFNINSSKTTEIIARIRTEIISILCNKFRVSQLPLKTEIFNGKEIKVLKYGDEDILYYNKLYENPTTLHITVAKILKDTWNYKYNVFNTSGEPNSQYFLNVCKNIIRLSNFEPLFSGRILTNDMFDVRISTM